MAGIVVYAMLWLWRTFPALLGVGFWGPMGLRIPATS